MTTPVREQRVTVPEQAGPVEPPAPEPVIDHVASHAIRCYWDFTQCRWVCPAD